MASKESPNQAYANSLFRFSYHCVRTLELSEANTRYGIRRTIKKCIFACTGHRDFSFDRVSDIGFKNVVILPRGTNTPLNNGGADEAAIGEERLLLQRNKWVIAHPDREPLIKQGAYPGLLGENKELYY